MRLEDKALDLVVKITEDAVRDKGEVSIDPEPTVIVEESSLHEEDAPLTRAPEFGGVTARNLFQHPLAHPLALRRGIEKFFGLSWEMWEPETLWLHLREHHGSWANFQKLLGLQAAIRSTGVEESWEHFLWVTMALNGIEPDFHIMQVPVAAQCGLAVSILMELRTPLWSSEVIDFIATVHRHDSLWTPVHPLEFVKLERPTDFVDFAQVDALWPRVKAARLAPAGDSPEAVQLQKMLACYEYVADWKRRLSEQEGLINALLRR